MRCTVKKGISELVVKAKVWPGSGITGYEFAQHI